MPIDFLYYVILGILFIGQLINVYGSFITSTEASTSIWNTYIAVLPYMVVQKLITTWGVHTIDTYAYISNNSIVLILLIFQFINTIIVSYAYLKIPIYVSDYVGCLLFAIGYYISIYNGYTSIF
jgi:hypothetical protein